jgi:hypothetical protein
MVLNPRLARSALRAAMAAASGGLATETLDPKP